MINKNIIENTITAALSTGGDFAEVFIEDKKGIGINMISGDTENIMSGRDFGIGIRIFKGYNSVYAYTNKSDEKTLIETAKKAAKAVIGENLNKDIVLNLVINPEILGGFIAETDSLRIDGSIKNNLIKFVNMKSK